MSPGSVLKPDIRRRRSCRLTRGPAARYTHSSFPLPVSGDGVLSRATRSAHRSMVGQHVQGSEQSQKHRHQRAHRLGQDDADRADPLLHPADPRDPRGAGQGRRRRHDGLDGARARARHHDRLGGDPLRVGGPPHQHHRHAGPRRLHDRGRARAARARRRDPGAVRASAGCRASRSPSTARCAATACRASPSSTSATALGANPSG